MIHILFSPSAAGTLRQLFRSRGIQDKVVDLTEWLDIGRIASDSTEDRVQWFQDRPPWKGNWDWAEECVQKFLGVVNVDDERLIWLAPQSAQEQSGFFWFLHRTRTTPNQTIIADYPLKNAWRGQAPSSLSELGQDQLAQLLDDAPRLAWDASRFPMEKWRSLMDDAAVLRIVENGVLKSARADHYDDWLVRWCPSRWTKWYRIVGDAMGHASQPIDDLFLRWRLQELIETGIIECDGQLPNWDYPTTVEPAKIRRLR